MTADSDPPEDSPADDDGDDAGGPESTDPPEDATDGGSDPDASAEPSTATADGDSDEPRDADDEESEIDRRSPFEDRGSDGDGDGDDGDGDGDGDDGDGDGDDGDDGDGDGDGDDGDDGDGDGDGDDDAGSDNYDGVEGIDGGFMPENHNAGGGDSDGDRDPDSDGDGAPDAEAVVREPEMEPEQPVPTPSVDEERGRDEPDGVGAGGDAPAAPDEDLTAAEKGMAAVNKGVDALGGGEDGPSADQEMPLTEHIEEMMRRLGVVFAIAGVVVVAVLLVGTVSPTIPSAEEIIAFLWDTHVGFEQNAPRVYGPLEFLLTKLKVASLAGLLVGLPVFVYQTYRFMRPGLYPHERRYYLAAVPTSLVLGLVGVAFAHFIVLPAIFNYFISYTEDSAVLAFSLRETFNLILLLMGYMAIVFQIPLFIQLAIMMGIVTREWMEDRRLLFWSAFVGLAFIVSPDPTGMSPIIVGATMIVLFEGTLALLRWTGN
ncbi:twin-arginine translocase subunit TatC [Halobaculum sp. CBA1158]|uniref:twin-arginine translocase subunit TatC n=1 Tax=Halobaculum sp. CBA1158 TaxID=2904243 RepID=UPI001F41692D|nr:twin-arginine translocase subunit TatC [Halobaculum sp. CBA1158]UIO99863.1 twin-arginine translocase subunit TatC [Halobaculum sp. CBA1158]